MTTRERCRCGGIFDFDEAVVPLWRCRDCWRELPLYALPIEPAWRRTVRDVALGVAVGLVVGVAVAVFLFVLVVVLPEVFA